MNKAANLTDHACAVFFFEHGVTSLTKPIQYAKFCGNITDIPDTEATGPQLIACTSKFLIHSPMNIKGDIANNWEFFKQQWNNNEVATSLEAQNDKVRRAAS